jgi:ABC-2 type transport system permease protein
MSAISAGAGTAHRRPGPFAALLRTELKLFLREPMLIFWGLLFPIALLVVLGLAGGNKHLHSLGGLRLIVVYTPVVMMFTLVILGLSALPAALASYRDKGYLRRLSTTPVGAARLLAAQIAIIVGLASCVVILILLVSHFAFSVPLPQEVGGFILAILLTMGAVVALGTLITALAPSQRIATAAGGLLLFPLMFFAGLWVPQQEMGSGLRDFSHYTPLGAATPAMQNAIAGQWPGTTHLLVLAGYAVLISALAVRLFRWE